MLTLEKFRNQSILEVHRPILGCYKNGNHYYRSRRRLILSLCQTVQLLSPPDNTVSLNNRDAIHPTAYCCKYLPLAARDYNIH